MKKTMTMMILSLCITAQAQSIEDRKTVETNLTRTIFVDLSAATIKCGVSNLAFVPTIYINVPAITGLAQLKHDRHFGQPSLVASQNYCGEHFPGEEKASRDILLAAPSTEYVELKVHRLEVFKLQIRGFFDQCINETTETVSTTIRGIKFYNFDRVNTVVDLKNCD